MLSATIGYVLAALVGVSLGLMGGGGSILATPILMYAMGVPAKSAIAMSLMVVGAVSLVGIFPHWRQGNINLKTAGLFAPAAMLGAYGGARIAALPIVTPQFQTLAFIFMMLVAAYFMIRKRSPSPAHPTVPRKMEKLPHGGLPRSLAIPLEGLGVGVLTGFVGIGGGFMVVPALVLLGGTPMKEAVGTSLVIIALKSVTGFAGYVGQVPIDWPLMVAFTAAASLGMLVGAYLNPFIEVKKLEKGFGYFAIAVAMFMVSKQFGA